MAALGQCVGQRPDPRRNDQELGFPKSEFEKFGALAGFVTHRSEATGERYKFVLAHTPVRRSPDAVARWERVLADAEKLVREKDIGKSRSRDKGFSR